MLRRIYKDKLGLYLKFNGCYYRPVRPTKLSADQQAQVGLMVGSPFSVVRHPDGTEENWINCGINSVGSKSVNFPVKKIELYKTYTTWGLKDKVVPIKHDFESGIVEIRHCVDDGHLLPVIEVTVEQFHTTWFGPK